ncbi:MAG: IS6 family transposase [Nitrososphaerales archaeon]
MTVCKYCGSTTIVRNGILRGSQRYLCKSCRHKFYDNGNGFVRMRTPTHVIVSSLGMYFDGLSVRKVSSQVNDIFGEKVSQVAIWSWIQKYGKMVSEYVKTLQPSLSGKYHHDETEFKVGGEGRYFWEMIDEDTRFLLAHHLSSSRTSEEASKVFRQALSKQRPIALFTDGSFAYDEAFSKVFYTRHKASRVEWIRRVGIRARETNNIVERLHGTLKDRLRPMRGLKRDLTARTLLDAYVAYYNFCRTHQALGKTPAQASGLEIKGWKELIRAAQTKKTLDETKPIMVEVKIRN